MTNVFKRDLRINNNAHLFVPSDLKSTER